MEDEGWMLRMPGELYSHQGWNSLSESIHWKERSQGKGLGEEVVTGTLPPSFTSRSTLSYIFTAEQELAPAQEREMTWVHDYHPS